MKQKALIAACAIPIIALIGVTFDAWRQTSTATSWTIPIEGVDPRDLIRGHYVTFHYVLPEETQKIDSSRSPITGWRVCFSGTERETQLVFFEDPMAQPPGCIAVGRQFDGHEGLEFQWARNFPPEAIGKIYIPEEHSQQLTKLLADETVTHAVRVAVADNGRVTPVDILIGGVPYRERLRP